MTMTTEFVPSQSFETIDLLALDDVNGGDIGAIVDAGNRAGNAGALIGGGVGAVAGGVGGAVGGTAVFPGPGSVAGAFGGAAAGAGAPRRSAAAVVTKHVTTHRRGGFGILRTQAN